MRSIVRGFVLGAAAVGLLAVGTTAHAQINPCIAAKIKCVSKKKACLLGVEAKARKKGLPVDAAKHQKCIDKFDGGADPLKGCFEKAEAKGGCVTFDDAGTMECKIDAFVTDVVAELDPNPADTLDACAAAKMKCVSKKNKCLLGVVGKANKTGVFDPAKIQKCFDKFIDPIDPTKGCIAKVEAKFFIPPSSNDCNTLGDEDALEAKVDAFDQDVLCELLSPFNLGGLGNPPCAGTFDSRRCTNDTRTLCTTNADCGAGTCEFWFGSNLPLSAGGVSTCVTNQWTGGLTGTYNNETGSSAGTASVLSRVYSGPTADTPCPKCVGDGAANDGTRGGTCDSGANAGATCDINGTSPNVHFGATSLDCPPLGGALIASLPIDLTNTTGTRSKTLSAASPNCRAAGFTTFKCFCDTCNNGNAEPCDDNADCPDPAGPIGPICGGRRCVGGANAGAACTVASECPGGACTVPGAATKPNECDDSTCSPDGGNEGTCAAGPFEQFCGPTATFQGCLSDLDCAPYPGNTCSVGKFRDCFTDNGLSGATVNATGATSTPRGKGTNFDCINQTFAALFCIGPTASSAVNAVAGLSGLGRLELPGRGFTNGNDVVCPTQAAFLPQTTRGVLDPGWTGQSHDAQVISDGLVTVTTTGCTNATPPCGTCTYTGPIPN